MSDKVPEVCWKKGISIAAAENKAVIRSFFGDVLSQGQLDWMNDLVVLDFVELDHLAGHQHGLEGLNQMIAAFRTPFPDIHWAIEEMLRRQGI